MMRIARIVRPFMFLTASVLIACSAPGPTVRSQSDPGADFGAYQTFGFFDELPGQAPTYPSFVDQHIKDAIITEMEARGYRREEIGQLMINYHRESKESVQVTQSAVPISAYHGYRRGFYGYRYGGTAVTTDVTQYTEGSILIDVVDLEAKQLLWQSVAVARVDKKMRDNPERAVDAAVKQMFMEFPGRR